jgi:hypothetical protein
MARRVSFAAPPTHQRRLPVADDAWGNEYVDLTPKLAPPPPPPPKPQPPQPPAPRPLDAPAPRSSSSSRFPALQALCLTALAQHTHLLADAAAHEGDHPDILRRALPSSDDRLALAAAARRRGELASALFVALSDQSWPVLRIDSSCQPPARAVVDAAKAGLLRGVRAVEWVLPSEAPPATTTTAAAAATGTTTTTTTTTTVLLPSEAAAVVRSLAAHCPALEVLTLRRADAARPTRPAVAAAVARAVLAAALPRGFGPGAGTLLPGGGGVVGRRRAGAEEEEEGEEQEEEEEEGGDGGTRRKDQAVVDSWEEALSDQSREQQRERAAGAAAATFAPTLRLLRWQDLPDAAAEAMSARCPRIALDRKGASGASSIDDPWLALLAPGWDDPSALLAVRRAEERARRESARGRALLLLPPTPDGGDDGDDGDGDDDDAGDAVAPRDKDGGGNGATAAAVAADGAGEGKGGGDRHPEDKDDDSVAARFRRAYAERARRLAAVERHKEQRRARRAVRASPALQRMERWLDEPV